MSEFSTAPEEKEEKKYNQELVKIVSKLGITTEQAEAYLHNTTLARTISLGYADMEQGLIEIDDVKSAMDISKILLFRGAKRKELEPIERDVETFWSTTIDIAKEYANNPNFVGEDSVILVTTLDKLPNLNQLQPHYIPSCVVAFGKAPELLSHLELSDFE